MFVTGVTWTSLPNRRRGVSNGKLIGPRPDYRGELSNYLKIPKSMLYKLVREGKVPCQKIGHHWRFRKESIDRWLEDLPAAPDAAQAGTHGDTKDGGRNGRM